MCHINNKYVIKSKSTTFLLCCALICYVVFGLNFTAQAQSFEESITRAESLINKEDKTPEETKELNELIRQAKSVPTHKRTDTTKKLINSYDKQKSIEGAQQTLEAAKQNLIDYETGKSNNDSKTTTINPKEELIAEVKYRELLLRRASEERNSDDTNLASLLNKQEELEQYKKDNQGILASQSSINAGGYAGIGQAMQNQSSDYRTQKKEIMQNIVQLTAEINDKKKNLSQVEQNILKQRQEEDEFIQLQKNRNIQDINLQKKYCDNVPPPECDWRNKATSSEIENYRKMTTDIITKNFEVRLCSNTCAPSCYMTENATCLFCDLFKVAFNTSSNMAKHSMETLAIPVFTLVVMAMAVWLAVTVLAFVSAPEVRDTKDLVTSLLNQSFIFAIVVILLQTGGSSFYNLALEPIFTTGMTIAEKTVTPTSAGAICKDAGGYGIIEGGLPSSMGNSIICTMTVVQERVAKIRALGSASICQSWKQRAFIIPHLGFLLTGLGLWIGASILMVAMPFLMLDAILQLAVAAALLPAAIGCYTFKITRGYVKKVWETFLNCMFDFMFLSIIVLILTTAFEQIILDATAGGLDNVIEQGLNVDMNVVLKDLSWFSVSFLKVVFVLILTWTVMGEINGFANQFASSISSTKIGSSIATMGASAAKGAAKNILGKPAEALASESVDMSQRVGRGMVHGIRRANFNRQTNKIIKQARESGGAYGNNFTVKNTDKKGRTTETKVIVNADGTRSMSKIRQIDANTREIVQKDAYFTIKTTESNLAKKKPGALKRGLNRISGNKNKNTVTLNTDESGKVVYRQVSETVRINNDAVNQLINKDGTYNESKMNEILDNSTLPKDKLKVLIANEVIRKRMPNLPQNMRDHKMGKQEVIANDDGGFTVSSVDENGNRTEIKIGFGSNGRMMSELTKIDSNGQAKRLSTDGILNRKQQFRVNQDGNIDEDSVRSTYAYTDHYKPYYDSQRYKNIPMQDSMFDEQEIKNANTFIGKDHKYRNSRMYEFSS